MPYLSISSATELSDVHIGIGCSAMRYTQKISNRKKMEPCHTRRLGSLISDLGIHYYLWYIRRELTAVTLPENECSSANEYTYASRERNSFEKGDPT